NVTAGEKPLVLKRPATTATRRYAIPEPTSNSTALTSAKLYRLADAFTIINITAISANNTKTRYTPTNTPAIRACSSKGPLPAAGSSEIAEKTLNVSSTVSALSADRIKGVNTETTRAISDAPAKT